MSAADDDMMRQLTAQWQTAADPVEISPVKLRRRLRRQQWLVRLCIGGETVLVIAALAITCLSFERLGRVLGSAMMMFVILTAVATAWARWGREQGDLRTVAGMIDLTISRARKSLRYVHASYLIAVAAVLLIALTVLIVSLRPRPPVPHDARQLWAIAASLIYTAVITAGVYVYERRVRRRLRRFEEMRAALRPHADAGASHE